LLLPLLQERQREQERQQLLEEQAEEERLARRAAASGAAGRGRPGAVLLEGRAGSTASREDTARLLRNLPPEGITPQQLGKRLPGEAGWLQQSCEFATQAPGRLLGEHGGWQRQGSEQRRLMLKHGRTPGTLSAGRPPKDGVYRAERVAAVLGYRLAADGSGKPRPLGARQPGQQAGGAGGAAGAASRPWNDVLEGACFPVHRTLSLACMAPDLPPSLPADT
jgi:hypothetical protein